LGDRGSVTSDGLEAVLRKIEHWHQGSIAGYRISFQDAKDLSRLKRAPDYVSLRLPQPMEYAEAQESLGVAGIERSVVDVIPALPGNSLPAAVDIQ
jgi:hypothetical protein